MRFSLKFMVKTFAAISCLLIFFEFIVYYVVQGKCEYPRLDKTKEDPSVVYSNEEPVKVMVLADTHLLGSRNGHWFDKLRREWQMHRSFQTAMHLHKPDIVFILGDLTDEGSFCNPKEFEYYVKRFYSLFAVPGSTSLYVTVGNHDIGFHYRINPYLNFRFEDGFNTPPVKIVTMRGNHFVLINSMAMEGDGCFLCKPAEKELAHIERILKCSKDIHYGNCKNITRLEKYSKPILMQHFPLYRQSDMECNEPDSAPLPIKAEKFQERRECLSQEATNQVLEQIRPRLAMSGHTHHGCVKPLPNGEGMEVTVPSFSWRNKENPSYSLLTLTPNNYAIFRCAMPRESSVISGYMMGVSLIIIWCIYSMFSRSRKIRCKHY